MTIVEAASFGVPTLLHGEVQPRAIADVVADIARAGAAGAVYFCVQLTRRFKHTELHATFACLEGTIGAKDLLPPAARFETDMGSVATAGVALVAVIGQGGGALVAAGGAARVAALAWGVGAFTERLVQTLATARGRASGGMAS